MDTKKLECDIEQFVNKKRDNTEYYVNGWNERKISAGEFLIFGLF